MTNPVLLPEDDGGEMELECTSYEKDPDGTLRLYLDGRCIVVIEPNDWDTSSDLCFYDPEDDEFLDVTDMSESYRAYLVRIH